MPKADFEVDVQSKTEVRGAKGELVNAPPQAAVEAAPKEEGKVTFSMYAAMRRIPEREQSGRRAFTKLTEATPAEWDAAFKKY